MADTTLQSYSKKIDDLLIDPLRQTLVGRKIVPVLPPVGFGVSAVEWSKITEMGDGMVSYAFTDTSDAIGAVPTTSKIPVYWKDYTVDRRAFAAYKNKSKNLDVSTAQSASYVAAKAEDEAIIRGVSRDGTTYEIDGLFTGAGSSYTDASDFDTAGVATNALGGAFALLADANVPVGDLMKYNLVLNNTAYMKLFKVRSANGIREMPEIKEMLNGGRIIGTSVLTAAEGMVLPADEMLKPYVDFYLGSDWKTEHGFNSEHPDTGDLSGRVYSTGILRIKHDVAICKFTNLT